jgi:protein-disulfide isomerase-like protein with CxxC motif
MSLVTEQHSMRNPRAVLYWYDFLCPFCYIGQSRNAVLVQHGFHLVELIPRGMLRARRRPGRQGLRENG